MLPPIRGVVVHGFPVGNTMFGHRTRLLHARKISPVTGKRIVRAGRLGNLDRLTAKTAPGRISGCSFSSRSTEWPYAAHGFAARRHRPWAAGHLFARPGGHQSLLATAIDDRRPRCGGPGN